MQVCNEGDYPERVMYYWTREFSSALVTGQGYSTLLRTIVISIVDFKFYELPKLPVDVSEDNMPLLWHSLFKAEKKKMKILIIYSSFCQQVVHKATIIIDKNDLFGE